ncbi:hypothetical protein ACQPZJ_18245 [Actinoplanes sp. CA-054009]
MLIRPLGAFERLMHKYSQKTPDHFSVVAEWNADLDPEALAAALLAVQRRHPLLNASVEPGDDGAPAFHRRPGRIPLTVAGRGGWEDLVARELATPFDSASAPLLRAVLRPAGDEAPAALVLTSDHSIADGLSMVAILRDLTVALNGGGLEPLDVPPPQEELIEGRDTAQLGEPPAGPEWLTRTGRLRPFDGSVPHLRTLALDADLTARLAARARRETATVHGALVTAITIALLESGEREYVRMFSPFAFRQLIDRPDDVADYFSITRTAVAREQLTDFWDMARTATAQVHAARTPAALAAISAVTEMLIPPHATPDDAVNFILGQSFEAFASNLGVIDLDVAGAVRPVAIWGPALLSHVDGEVVTGISTYEGRLRMLTVTHDPLPGFLGAVHEVLAEHC